MQQFLCDVLKRSISNKKRRSDFHENRSSISVETIMEVIESVIINIIQDHHYDYQNAYSVTPFHEYLLYVATCSKWISCIHKSSIEYAYT